MPSLQNLSPRDKNVLAAILVLATGALIYFGVLQDFLDRWDAAREALDQKTEALARQRRTLAESAGIDEKFSTIESSLPKSKSGRSPDKVFAEDMEKMFNSLRMPTPEFGKIKEVETKVTGLSYLVLPILRMRGNLETIANLLRNFADRNLLIMRLSLRTTGTSFPRDFEMTVEVAQVVATESLSETAAKKNAADKTTPPPPKGVKRAEITGAATPPPNPTPKSGDMYNIAPKAENSGEEE